MINLIELTEDLIADEGVRESAYTDSLGFLTIGVGHLIDSRRGGKLSQAVIKQILADDIQEKVKQVYDALPWVRNAPEGVQRALVNMCFQLGINGLLGFKNTLKLIQEKKYNEAADNALLSAWAKQTPNRAKRVTDLIRKG